MNRLSTEKSPYLLQHKNNPVHWYPWGDKAFEDAAALNRPIFLSIGYATCHWCHVMERESFEDSEVASVLNTNYISIKVDREERPDVDQIYMSVAQLLNGTGGWPLTIVMTPEAHPFFAATYIPRKAGFGNPGIIELLETISQRWIQHKNRLVDSAAEITRAVRKLNAPLSGVQADESLLHAAYAQLKMRYEPTFGGFSRGTKFPTPHNLIFLLRYNALTNPKDALSMAETTLRNMRAGGIFDHVGYGFHRYSTDSRWLVPHFEKMLYDQSLLMLAYSEAYDATRNPLYAQTIEEIAEYLDTRMKSATGGFYSAEDADSEHVEGKYYLWAQAEIDETLGADAANFNRTYNIAAQGNFHSHQTPPQMNIPHLSPQVLNDSQQFREANRILQSVRKTLLNKRNRRIPPILDDKILTDWNGLTIGALARAGRLLNRPLLTRLSSDAADFVLRHLHQPDGTLLHRYRENDAAIAGMLDDYAYFIFGLIELHQATFDIAYIEQALTLIQTAKQLMMDEDGSFFEVSRYATDLIVRPKEYYDGALPSGNSVMLENMIRLSRITGDSALEKDARRLADTFAGSACSAPGAYTYFMIGLHITLGASTEVVVVGEPDDAQTAALIQAVLDSGDGVYLPNKMILVKSAMNSLRLSRIAPYTRLYTQLNNLPTAYVCSRQTCATPTSSPTELRAQMKTLSRKNYSATI